MRNRALKRHQRYEVWFHEVTGAEDFMVSIVLVFH